MSNVVIDFVVKDGSLFIQIKQKQLQCLRVTLRCIYVNCRLSKCDHLTMDFDATEHMRNRMRKENTFNRIHYATEYLATSSLFHRN